MDGFAEGLKFLCIQLIRYLYILWLETAECALGHDLSINLEHPMEHIILLALARPDTMDQYLLLEQKG